MQIYLFEQISNLILWKLKDYFFEMDFKTE